MPSKPDAALAAWIAPRYLDEREVARLARAYEAGKPFPHAALEGFLQERQATRLARALRAQEFSRKESDLFCFSQTKDLLFSQDPTIREFIALLRSEELRALMHRITGVRLAKGRIDAMGVIYADADYLLCHDDQLSGRKVAYILNLSKGFTKASGGALALLASDRKGRPTIVAKRIVPTWNTLSFFTVSGTSHHMVEEVLVPKERLTIGGWLHG